MANIKIIQGVYGTDERFEQHIHCINTITNKRLKGISAKNTAIESGILRASYEKGYAWLNLPHKQVFSNSLVDDSLLEACYQGAFEAVCYEDMDALAGSLYEPLSLYEAIRMEYEKHCGEDEDDEDFADEINELIHPVIEAMASLAVNILLDPRSLKAPNLFHEIEPCVTGTGEQVLIVTAVQQKNHICT